MTPEYFSVFLNNFNQKYKMKIIFLDIDGVLQPYNTSARFKLKLEELNKKLVEEFNDVRYLDFNHFDSGAAYADWHPVALQGLRTLCEKGKAQIVVTSDWRYYHDLPHMRLLFKLHGLDQFILDIIPLQPDDEKPKGRTEQVHEYLLAHPEITNFVVLDDIHFKFPEFYPKNFVLCKGHLTELLAAQALTILKRRKKAEIPTPEQIETIIKNIKPFKFPNIF